MKRLALCFLAGLVALGVANAAIAQTTIFNGTIYDLLVSDPFTVGAGAFGENLVGMTITVVNTTGEVGYDPDVIDCDYFGYTGITGKFHQHRSTILGSDSPVATDPFATVIDSHWELAGEIYITPPSETYDVWASNEPTDALPPFDGFAETSFGDEMGGTFVLRKLGEPHLGPEVEFVYLVSQPNQAINVNCFLTGPGGGEHVIATYTVGQGVGSYVDAGYESGVVGGGSGAIGGFDYLFDEVTSAGLLDADYHVTAADPNDGITFDLPDGQLHEWEVGFGGDFDGGVTMTLNYLDLTGAPDLDEEDLFVYHQLSNGYWEQLPVLGRDLEANTITVMTTGFSPLALGGGKMGDLDGDNDVDADDIDLLCGNMGGDPGTYDFDGDGDVDFDDLKWFVEHYVEYDCDGDGIIDGQGTFMGDFTLDGRVNVTDIQVMRGSFGISGLGWADGNANCDSLINLTDLQLLQPYYGLSKCEGGSGGEVPEPLTIGLLGIGAAALLRRRR